MIDCHTHHHRANAVIDIDPIDSLVHLRRGFLYSVGIHPWNVFRVDDRALRLLRALAAEPQVLAVGECGIDLKIRDRLDCPIATASEILARQTSLLEFHFDLSESLRKPLILHIVKAFSEIINLRRIWKPSQPWIIHGFRGKPQLASELVRHGFHLSFGAYANPDSVAATPSSRALVETDESLLPLTLIRRRIGL